MVIQNAQFAHIFSYSNIIFCSIWDLYLIPRIKHDLGRCRLSSRRDEMHTTVVTLLNSDPLNFDINICKLMSGNEMGDETGFLPCASRESIKEQCLDVDRAETGCT